MSENHHLMIATPMYGGVCTMSYCVSLALTVADASRQKRNLAYKPGGDSLVTRARNLLTEEFLKSDCTHLLWIDADIGWEPSAIWRMIDSGKDIVAGVYPKKTWPISWPMNFFMQEENAPLPTCPETGFIRVKDAPTGFMLIRRHVIETLLQKHPEWRCRFSGGTNPVYGTALWEAFIDDDGMYLSEDFGFCRRAQAEGFEVWIDPTIKLSHTGNAVYGPARMSDAMTMIDVEDNNIEGWCTPAELGWLKSTAATVNSVVEVGCWKGRSTVALASGCPGTVYAVDHWMGSEGEREGAHKEATERDIFEDFRRNVAQYRNVTPIRESSINAALQTPDASVDLVYIDAGHTYEEVKADIEAWKPKARRVICGHDFNYPEVARAVRETLGEVQNPVGAIWVKVL